jgi:UDP-N-acetylmuramoyl-tripeptide--D-alanyl-D-alanine ligase
VAHFKFSELIKPLEAGHSGADATFNTVTIDSRNIKSGDLFIAIKGPNFDGHDFINEAQKQGACGVMVEKEVHTDLPVLKVADTRLALGRLGALRRAQLADLPLISVTGSCGKTTTKTMMAAILKQKGNTLATEGTLNNDYGVPLTLLKLQEQHDYAVIEMGANHFEEIAYLTQMAKPHVAVITNAGPVHLEGFGNVYGVAQAKGEIFRGLIPSGVAVLNADDAHFEYWQALVFERKKVTFGENANADYRAVDVCMNAQHKPEFHLCSPLGEIKITLPLLGRHNVLNALAAAAATAELGASLKDIQQGLAQMEPVNKRLNEYQGRHGEMIIDDSYNANPAGMAAALSVLMQYPGKRIMVLGSMGELGDLSEDYHYALGQQIRDIGVDVLLAVGDLALHTVNAFGAGATHFNDQNSLLAELKPLLSKDAVILVKGSRFMKMENIVQELIKG